MNLIEPILFQAKLNPMALAICVPGSKLQSVSYGQLVRFIHNTARMALKSGIAPGSVVATYINDTILHMALSLGLMHVGVATLSLRSPKPVAEIAPDIILTDAPGKITSGGTVLNIDYSWLESGGPTAEPAPSYGDDGGICRIVLTSGSTGEAKGLAFSHKAMAERMAYDTFSKGSRFAHCRRLYCDLGIATSPGFRYAIGILRRGGTIYLLGPDPADILQAVDLHKIEGMATAPYGLGEFLKFFEADSAFEVTFDHIICQGAMLPPQLSQRVRARMCQNLYSSYGSTETTTVAFGPANVLEKIPGAVGYIQPGVIVEAIDDSGHVLPSMQDGELRIRTSHMAEGYVGDPDSTRAFFRDGYFYSGDIGHVTREGILVISGRAKTALNIGGDTVTPELVEDVISAFAGIREAGVFAAKNDLGISELHALIVTSSLINDEELRSHCTSRLPPSCVPVRFLIVDALPRGGQGKVERHRFAEIASLQTQSF